MQHAEIQAARRSAGEPRIIHQVDPPHGAQPRRKGPAANNAGRDGEIFALRSCKERTISGAEHRRLRPDVIIGKIDVRAFVDREQRRRHCDVDILAPPGPLAAIERRKYRDHGLQSSVDVGMRQAVGTRLRQARCHSGGRCFR